MFSLLVKEKLYINEVVLGTACGVIFGPYCANIFNPRAWGGDLNVITLEVMRITLAAGLFAIGVELPQSYLADHAKGLFVMVVPTMAFGWLVVAAIIFVVFPNLNFISSMVIAACLTPTDPIISAAIVGGKFATKHVPLNLRRLLAAESAANDGLAYPFLSISIYLSIETSRRVAIGEWFLVGWLYQVILGTIIGAVLGLGFSYLMKFSLNKGFIDRESYVAQYLALALFTIGVTRTLGSDDLLAAFAAGSAISWDGHFNTQTEDEVFSSVIDLMLNCGCFIYIGAWMPFNMFNAPELYLTPWRLVIVFLAVIFLRRFPPLLLLYPWVPEIASWKEALFSGHFGMCCPMGVGAIFISTLAVTELPTPQSPPQGQAEVLAATLQTIVSFVVLGSIIIHGLSIPFFSFGRNVHSRTLSLSRTWTSRTTNAPDWLLGARSTPAEVTQPASPVMEGRDVEQGMEEVDPTNLTKTVAKSQEDVNKERHVPELGPAAMINDATAKSAVSQPASSDDESRTPIETGNAASPDAKSPENEDRPGNDRPPLSTDDDLAGRPRLASGVQTPASDSGMSTSRSGTQTPSSPGPRAVRFPPADELATYLAAHRAASAGGTQPPSASARAVRFPEDASASASASASQPARGPGASDVVGDAGVTESETVAAALGADASVVSAQ
ncbi:Sodium/hydrogen exchanger family-domain-containing protein [Ganoderma leucocontextum]|nr:Sodium/hydrogen exchanger family-domain-containing protein [Ganoderma leucocontextum]